MHSILFYPDINYLLVYAFVHQSKHFFILYYILQPFLFRYYKPDRKSNTQNDGEPNNANDNS
jgi:hypothetical protein